jgi:uncharacterized protein
VTDWWPELRGRDAALGSVDVHQEEFAVQESTRVCRGSGSRAIGLALLTFALVLSPVSFASAAGGPDLEKDKLVRELIALTGSDQIGMQVLDAMLQQFQAAFKAVPAEYWVKLRQGFKAEELVDLVVPIYAKNFSTSELKELIGFYQTPIGKKVIKTLPTIAGESMSAGQAWGQKKAAEILEQLKRDGYKQDT